MVGLKVMEMLHSVSVALQFELLVRMYWSGLSVLLDSFFF